MKQYYQTHLRNTTCGIPRKEDVSHEISLTGWVHRRRDHGHIIFVDLRDRTGLIQIVFDPTIEQSTHTLAQKLRHEWVIAVKGKVRLRGEGMHNPKLMTGEIEVEIYQLTILNTSDTPPFSLTDEDTRVSEELRLKYRYLDLRRESLFKNLQTRHQTLLYIRQFLDQRNFLEIETPILTKSTPEGARDYLVPSRVFPGSFFALPQSPQLYKQLCMIGGLDRYFQIARCFRDEDLRSDRQPEFTQVDIEMSFVSPDDLMTLMEEMLSSLFRTILDVDIPFPFPRMTHRECLERYGTDRPDLRFDMPLIRLDDLAEQSTLEIFKGLSVKGLCLKNGAQSSRKEIDQLVEFVRVFGLQGLSYAKVTEEGLSANIAKFFSPGLQKELMNRMGAETGDLLLLAAGDTDLLNQALDHLRRHLAHLYGLIPSNVYAFLWVTDFPLFTRDKTTSHFTSEHHPFTAPHVEDLHLFDTNPLAMRSFAYDMVLNGSEIGGGSIRNHDPVIQKKIFQILSLSEASIEEKFGFFIQALQYGAPPHGGIAFGVDRLAMILSHTENIRDVIAFPKTQKAADLMMQAPAIVSIAQLDELGIALKSSLHSE